MPISPKRIAVGAAGRASPPKTQCQRKPEGSKAEHGSASNLEQGKPDLRNSDSRAAGHNWSTTSLSRVNLIARTSLVLS